MIRQDIFAGTEDVATLLDCSCVNCPATLLGLLQAISGNSDQVMWFGVVL